MIRSTWHDHLCFTIENISSPVMIDSYQDGIVPGRTLWALIADAVYCNYEHLKIKWESR